MTPNLLNLKYIKLFPLYLLHIDLSFIVWMFSSCFDSSVPPAVYLLCHHQSQGLLRLWKRDEGSAWLGSLCAEVGRPRQGAEPREWGANWPQFNVFSEKQSTYAWRGDEVQCFCSASIPQGRNLGRLCPPKPHGPGPLLTAAASTEYEENKINHCQILQVYVYTWYNRKVRGI